MGVKRTRMKFESEYVQLPNAWMRDEKLSRRARGLLAEIMTHRVGWRVSLAGLVKTGPEGRDAISTALGELIKHGYLIRSQSRGDDGRLQEVEYELQDPAAAPSTATGFPGSGEGTVHELSTGETTPWFTASGSTVSGSTAHGESAPKEEHLEEDQGREERAAAPTPFCSKHPKGTDRPCRGCQQARINFDATLSAAAAAAATRAAEARSLRYPPSVYCEHLQLRAGDCDACTREARLGALEAAGFEVAS